MPKYFTPGRYKVRIVSSKWRVVRDAEKLVMDLDVIESLDDQDIPNTKYPPSLWFSWTSEKLCKFNIDRLRHMGWAGERLADTFVEDSLVGLEFEAEVQHKIDSDYDNWEVVMPPREKSTEDAVVDKRRLSNLDRMVEKMCRSTLPTPSTNGKPKPKPAMAATGSGEETEGDCPF